MWHLIPFKSQVYPKYGTISIITPRLGKGIFFSDESNLTTLVRGMLSSLMKTLFSLNRELKCLIICERSFLHSKVAA